MSEWPAMINCFVCDPLEEGNGIYFASQGACPVCGHKNKIVNQITEMGNSVEIKKPKQKGLKVRYDDIVFDSKIESERYLFLRDLQDIDIISELQPSINRRNKQIYQLLPKILLPANDLRDETKQAAMTYTPDFQYWYKNILIIEDVKDVYGDSKKNRLRKIVGKPIINQAARLRHKLLQANYPNAIFKIVTNPSETVEKMSKFD